MSDAVLNTDRELYRGPDVDGNGDYYSDSIHVTQGGSIGINVGGLVIVKPLSEWHGLAQETPSAEAIRGMVKPLVWECVEGFPTHLVSGPYEISFSGNMKRSGLHFHYTHNGLGTSIRLSSHEVTEESLEEDQAVAEAHHVNTILAALGLTE